MSDPGRQAVLLDATLRPNPPMSSRALGVVLAIVAGMNFVFALSFVLKGAWPIAPFMGLDVALLAWAFRESRLRAKAFERIRLTMSELLIALHPARGAPRDVTLNPYWTRVDYETTGLPGARLTVTSHGRSVQIGRFLGEPQRAVFALRLKSALQRAKGF
ncbi:MAG TPA: DUF2244 domain-containing protein [Rhizomicrobium sp.]|jgi:uncharacterized membrane protein